MDGVNRVSRKGATTNHASSVDHRRLQKSSTLNRRFVRRPGTTAAKAATIQQQGVVRKQISQAQTVKTGAQMTKQTVQAQQQRATIRAVSGAAQQQGAKQNLIQRKKMGKIQPSAAFLQQQRRLQLQKQQGAQQQVGRRVDAQQLAKIRQQAVMNLKKTQQAKAAAAKETKDVGPQQHKLINITRAKMAARQQAKQQVEAPVMITAQERKDQAIQQALQRMKSAETTKMDFGEQKAKKQFFWQKKRFAVAMAMAIISIGLLGYLVSLNLPDLSVRVAAMHTGISNAYPSYVPSNFRLDGLVKEDDGKITMNFKNDLGKTFSLTEEKSSWDSASVLANYVKKNWGEDYSVVKGQGLTIYISESRAAWVNGGVFYIVDGEAAELSSSDLHDIAVSL